MMDNVLIIGFGSSSKRHIKNILKLKKKVYFFILSRKKKIILSGLNKKNYKHVKKINEVNFNIINDSFICTGSNEHFKFIKILTKKKINIFVEKPLMNSLLKMKEFKQIIKNYHHKIYVGYNLIFSESLNSLKKLKLKKNEINKVKVKAGYYLPFWRKNLDYKSSVSASRKKGGGVLLELSHEIQYLLWLFGKPLWTSAILEKKSNLKIDVEDTANIILGYDKFSCLVELDFISKKYVRFCQIDTNKYTYFWNFKKNLVKKFYNQYKSKIFYKRNFNLNQTYMDQLKFYINSSYMKTNKYINYAIDTLNVIEAIKVSSKNKGKIKKINYKY
jgi:predicted dehydrogenase